MTFNGCDFFSCDQMWRGIAVEHNYSVLGFVTPSFNFTNCQIEDAASALWFKNPNLAVVFQINGNTFNKVMSQKVCLAKVFTEWSKNDSDQFHWLF